MFKRLRNLLSPSAIPGTAVGLRRSESPAVLARGMSGVSPQRRCDPPSTEQRAALFCGRHITYTLKRSSRRRSIGLRIDGRGLTVSVPHRTPERLLRDVLKEKAAWVVEKLDGWQSRKAQEICWADGESVPYLGELLMLRVVQTAPAVQQHNDELRIYLRGEVTSRQIEQRVTKWYRQQALSLFAARAAHYAPQLGVAPLIVKLSTAKTQWGSCTRGGTVRLNLQLIKLPLHLIDYVVVHELAHLREMNHSDAFWRVVASACPDYAKLRRELKTVGL